MVAPPHRWHPVTARRAQLGRLPVNAGHGPAAPQGNSWCCQGTGDIPGSLLFFSLSNKKVQACRMCHITPALGLEPSVFAPPRARAASSPGLGTDTHQLSDAIFLLQNKFVYSNVLLP